MKYIFLFLVFIYTAVAMESDITCPIPFESRSEQFAPEAPYFPSFNFYNNIPSLIAPEIVDIPTEPVVSQPYADDATCQPQQLKVEASQEQYTQNIQNKLIALSFVKSQESARIKANRQNGQRIPGKYCCPFCSQIFRWPWGLNYHTHKVCKKNPNTNTDLIPCHYPGCNHATKRQSYLNRHIASVHLLKKARPHREFNHPTTRSFAKKLVTTQVPLPQ